MTDPYGHPAQPSPAERRPSGVAAILDGFAALALAGILGYFPANVFIDYGIDDLPRDTKIVLGLYLGAAVILLIGALITFFRAVAGAVLLLIGGLATIAAVVTEPLLLYPDYFGQFFKAMFQFVPDDAFVRVAATVGGPVVLVLSSLPWTFRYLRYRPGEYPVVSQKHPERSHPSQGW
ncbi:hypothetical protein LWP59_33680 [Amycolatopsis acidiphila]|uniref:Uncharacterized protein n=1 Tax=Amycolatopsis acidiphila TaxID=715473 RepID=A0A557ZUB7_9PSEU|nr:hypothetical protein [Amycolatopsis acidiphila]TVT15595.1 hypothetical protein FNH06_35960 [Amycolatopsis acidiphila]UIJ58976.1 hypothetical protein LWP59_33680 [Amycolatopsis acidiphila]GHG73114.1 hypothetical protein GCM10017788_36210 [Amycolatopsis acidiphila]